jgi:sterol desaturase/sphingolipid hydroxylase (fatty acid hydroxylase superfamily)
MPTPLDLVLDPISLCIITLFGGLWLAEGLWPGRPLPQVPAAQARGFLWFTVYFFGSSYLPYAWADALAPYRLFDLTSWPTPAQVLLGVLAYELVGYFYHRALHASDFLFRFVHQTHHASERLDVPSAFAFHPLDIVGWTLVTTIGLSVVVGLSAAATAASILIVTFLSIFQHANLRTPRWVGYLVQRPESHSRHHARGHHRNNYADLPLFDLAFGTFENPAEFSSLSGYCDGASTRLGDLLLGRDVAGSEAS